MRFGVGRIKANGSLEFRCSSWGFLLRVGFAEGAMDFADVWICLLQGLQLGDARAGVAGLDQGCGVGELEARSFAWRSVEWLQCLARGGVVLDGELAES